MTTVHTEHPSVVSPPEPQDPFAQGGGMVTWRRGLIEPRRAHVQETEHGAPRTIPTHDGRVAVAICQAWLTGVPIAPTQLADDAIQRCTVCSDYSAQLPNIPHPQGNTHA